MDLFRQAFLKFPDEGHRLGKTEAVEDEPPDGEWVAATIAKP